MNWKRILAGGLLAGLIINVGELLLYEFVLASEWESFREALGQDAAFRPEQYAAGIIITFLFGIAVIWLYAAIRPRFGPGPKTAVIAGGALWFVAYALFNATFWAADMLSFRLAIGSILWGLIEAPVAALAGAWVYREDEAETELRPRAA